MLAEPVANRDGLLRIEEGMLANLSNTERFGAYKKGETERCQQLNRLISIPLSVQRSHECFLVTYKSHDRQIKVRSDEPSNDAGAVDSPDHNDQRNSKFGPCRREEWYSIGTKGQRDCRRHIDGINCS